MVEDEIWSIVGSVIASKYKREILYYLSKGAATPKQISNGTDIRINHVSNYLIRLADDDLLECLNPDAKMGRLYKLTEKGEEIFGIINKLDRDLD